MNAKTSCNEGNTVKEIKKVCKARGIHGYSRLRKKDLVEKCCGWNDSPSFLSSSKKINKEDAVDVYKYTKTYSRDPWEEVQWKTMEMKDYIHVCRFSSRDLKSMFKGGNEAMYADEVLSSRAPYIVDFKKKHCVKGVTRLREPDFICYHSKFSGNPTCQMLTKMDPESAGETGAKYMYSPSYYWGKDKLVPEGWKS